MDRSISAPANTNADNLHREATRLAEEAESARRQGNEALARNHLTLAFAHERQAADILARDYSEKPATRLLVLRNAGLLAMQCGAIREAERLLGNSLQFCSNENQRKELFKLIDEAESLWQKTEGIKLKEVAFKVPVDTVQIAFSPDSHYLVCAGHQCYGGGRPAGSGNIVHVYDLQNQRLESHFKVEFKQETPVHHYGINGICFSPDGLSLAMTAFDGLVLVWDWETRKKRHLLPGHNQRASCVAFSPDGKKLASTGFDFRIKLWDAFSGKKLGSFKARRQIVDSLAFTSDGDRIAWGCEGGYITLFELATRREVYSFRPHKDDVYSLAFSPCGRILASVSLDRTVKLFEAESGSEILTLHGGHKSLAFSPNGRLLASTWENDILLWDLKKKVCLRTVRANKWRTLNVRFSPDGKILAASGFDSIVRFWNVEHLLAIEPDLSALSGLIGKAVRPANPRPASDWKPPVAKAGPGPGKLPPPEHLAHCTVPIKSQCTSKRFVAEVQCPCGCKGLELFHTGSTCQDEKGGTHSKVAEVEGGFFLIVKAKCPQCQLEHVLFDRDFHGWNGFVCRNENHLRPRPELFPWKCTTCGERQHSVKVLLAGEGKVNSIDESWGKLDESNWQEGFGWIELSIKCCKCGNNVKSWLSHETM